MEGYNTHKRALLSVSDKNGLVPFAQELVNLGYELVSTGGTAVALRKAGLSVKDVSDVTGFPEMMDGRVKTLHPLIHAGILADRSNPDHVRAINALNIKAIDIVVVNLYPFLQTISKPDVAIEEAVENIDIGGPSLIRAAAKNHGSVAVLVDPNDYESALRELKNSGGFSIEFKRRLMAKAFAHTAAYDSYIAEYFGKQFDVDYPLTQSLTKTFQRVFITRYGENPHQKAAFYRDLMNQTPTIASARQLWGKEISYNNMMDADAALELVREFDEPAVAVIKHANPCGLAVAENIAQAFILAKSGDPEAAFGGIIAANRPIDEITAEKILEKGSFFEVIIAPSYSTEAVKMISERKGWGADVRLLEVGDFGKTADGCLLKSIGGGALYQTKDMTGFPEPSKLKMVTERKPTEAELTDLKIAWIAVKHVKSNAITIAKQGRLIGVGAGQMKRVQSVRLALEQAGEEAKGAVLASDAFFPFADSIETAGSAGVTAFIQPGGSKRDQDSIDAANKLKLAMVFTGERHFKH